MKRDPGAPEVVYVASNPMEAEVVKARLQSYGIQVALEYQSIGRVIGLYLDGWGETRVLVPAEQAEEARAILAEDPVEGDEGPGLQEG